VTRIAVFQHVAHEILGNLHPALKDAGLRIRYVNFDRGPVKPLDVARYDGLVILGGPMGVYDADKYPHLTDEITAIQQMIAANKPVLGICLGSQLIAAALGARVYASGKREIGWYDVHLTPEGKADPVLGSFEEREKVFQWHGDTFDLPAGAVHLATSPMFPHQAFRYGDRVYGLQFHLEVDVKQIERWLKLPANGTDIAAMGGAEWAAAVRAENEVHLKRLERASRGVFASLVELFARG
jgi:GMP synthase (glutamine-hydrolysing)